MKKILFILFTLAWVTAQAQTPEKRFVGNCQFTGFSLVSDSTYIGNITSFTDRFGDGYNASMIIAGYEIIDGRGLVYVVDSVLSASYVSASVKVVAKVNRGFAPFGSGQVYNPTNLGLIPASSVEQAGLSPVSKARIDRHNVVQLDSFVRMGIDTIYSIAYVPDTSGISPNIGDAFINATADTLGLYSGAAWVLFFGGDNADGNGIFDSDGIIAPDDDFFIKIPNDSVFAIGSSTKSGLVDYWFTGGSSDYFRGFFYDPYVNNRLGFGDIRGDGTQMTFHVDRDRYSRMEARSSTNVGGSIQIGTNNAPIVLERGRLSFNGTNTIGTFYILRFPDEPSTGNKLWLQSGTGSSVDGSWIDVDAVGTWLQPELEAGDVTIDGTGNLLDITTQKTSLNGDSLGLDFLNFSLSDDPETGLYAGSFDPGWSFNINNNEFNIQAGDSATLGYSVGISTLGSNQMNVYGTNGTNTYNYTLPTTSPSNGQVLGYSGAPYNELQWVTASSSSPDSADFATTYALADTAATLRSDLANQTLSWNPATGELSLSPGGNTVDIDDRYLQGVTTDATLTGDGSIVSPLVVDTTEIATQYDLAQSVDSTRLTQDSILIYYQGGVEVGRDTISVAGSGGGGVTGSGASPRIAYWSGTSTLTSNSGFAWDPALSNLIANSGSASLTGGSNALVGSSAGLSVTTGSNNNFFGQSAGSGVTTGNNNNYFGTSAGANNLSGNGNNFFGTSSGISSTSSNSNFFGTNTGRVTTGNNNNFLGNNCGYSNTSGSVNFFSGNSAGYYNTTGSNNVFIGNQTGNRTTTGSENIAISTSALLSNTTGSYNISIGSGTLNGGAALGPLTGNIAIGYEAGDNVVSGADRNIAIGYRVDLPVAGNDNQITIGNLIFGTGASGTGTTAAGKMGILQPAPQYTIDINATDGARIPVGTTAQQPTGANGVIRYNSTTSAFEGYSNAAYRAFYQESTANPTSILGKVGTGLAGNITVGERLSLSSGQLDVSQRWANMRKASANVYAFSTTPEQIDTLDGSSSGGLFSIGATGVATYSNTANRVYQISWQVTFSSDTADKEVTFKVYEAGTGSDYNQATQYAATSGKKYSVSGVYSHTANNTDTFDIRGYIDSGTANVTIHNISIVFTEM